MSDSDSGNEAPASPLALDGGAFGSLRALGECQLQIQFMLASTYDTQGMGLLGLNTALAVAAFAGNRLLGELWWIAPIGLFASSLLAGFALFIRAEAVGLALRTNIGSAEGASRREMDRGIVIAVSEAIDENDGVLKEKRDRVWMAMSVLLASVVSAVVGVLVF